MRIRLSALICAGALGALTLTGCGSDLGPDLHPGNAAVVGDESISIDDVDDLSDDLCGFYSAVSGAPGSVAMVRAQVLTTKIDQAKAEAYADEFDIDARPYVRFLQKDFETRIGEAPLEDDQKDIVREFVSAGMYAQAVQIAVGMDGRPIPENEQQQQQVLQAAATTGAQEVAEWTESLKVTTDPRYAEFSEEGVNLDPAALSVSAANPDNAAVPEAELQAAMAALPASQKCE